MLSLKRCRELLGKDCELSDEELEILLVQLYQIGGVALQMATQQREVDMTKEPFDPLKLPKDVLRPTGQRRRRGVPRAIYCGRFN